VSLERIDPEVRREQHGFSFCMRIKGSEDHVRVFVADDALTDEGSADMDGMRTQFNADEKAFEELASDRHSNGRVSASGFITISLADLTGIIE
jgi:hypothetical protein